MGDKRGYESLAERYC